MDLLAALQRSVDKAKAAKSGGTSTSEIREEADAEKPADTAKKAPAKKAAAKKAPAKKAAAKKTTTKKVASKRKAS